MINHIGKYNDAQAIQDALDAEMLANPYVAMTSAGTIDYNSLQPTPPAPSTMGVWSDDGQGVYTFQITETGTTYWENPVNIGSLDGVYFQGMLMDMDVVISWDPENGWWHMELQEANLSENPGYEFLPGDAADTWYQEGVLTEPDSSNAYLQVYWDGVDTFVFQRYTDGSGPAISMTTINPEYPVGE